MANEIIICCISGRKYFIFNCSCIQATRNNTRRKKCMIFEFHKQCVGNGALGNEDKDLVFPNLRNSGSQRKHAGRVCSTSRDSPVFTQQGAGPMSRKADIDKGKKLEISPFARSLNLILRSSRHCTDRATVLKVQ